MSRGRVFSCVMAVVVTGTLCVVASSTRCSADDVVFPGEKWMVATPDSQGLDRGKLKAAVDYLAAHTGRDGVRELLIVRNGRLVWQGDNIDKVHGVWSCTKSFTSTALGLLVDDGVCALDSSAKQFVPELSVHYGGVQLRHFTTMTSGYRAVGDEPRGGYKHGPSGTPFRPSDSPLFVPPGSYRPVNEVLVGDVQRIPGIWQAVRT